MSAPRRDPSSRQLPGQQLMGMLLIARGRREGLGYFRNDSEAVTAAMAPWVALWLVAVLLAAIAHRGRAMLPLMALTACSMLAPPVLTEALSRLWRRRELWPRFAAATFWCEWLMVPVYALALLVAAIVTEAGTPPAVASGVFAMLAVGYWAWLHWFVARHGLRLGRVRAAALVVALVALMSLLGLAGEWLLPQLRGPLVPHVQAEDHTADAPGAGPLTGPRAENGSAGKADTTWQF